MDTTEKKESWYTTTFSIPKWLRKELKKEVKRGGYRGMNEVVVVACTNHMVSKMNGDPEKSDIVEALFQQDIINENEKKILLR